jgi:histidinol-phosphate aminotransferase
MTMAAGRGVLADEEYTRANCRAVAENRDYTARELKKMGFEMTDSFSNFIFAKHPRLDGGLIYSALREKGVLVRHFTSERIAQYNRITVGSREQMDAFLSAISEILEENK